MTSIFLLESILSKVFHPTRWINRFFNDHVWLNVECWVDCNMRWKMRPSSVSVACTSLWTISLKLFNTIELWISFVNSYRARFSASPNPTNSNQTSVSLEMKSTHINWRVSSRTIHVSQICFKVNMMSFILA